MAYSISGFVRDEANNPVPNCYYQFLFLKVHELSSPTTWSEIKQADHHGYYSADIADASIIGTKGNYNVYDEVLIACWIGDSERHLSLTKYSDWTHVITDVTQEHLVQDLIIFTPQPPIAHFTGLPAEGVIDTNYDIYNDSTAIWIVEGYDTVFHQHCEYRTEPIFNDPCIDTSEWTYGDSTTAIILSGLADGNHTWTAIGIYDVTLKVTTRGGLFDTYTEQIIIKYTVIADFIYDPDPAFINEIVDFTNTSIDTYNRVTKYRWEMYDGDILLPPSDVYEGDYDLGPSYIFVNDPDRCVKLIAFWNDGFDDQEATILKCLPVLPNADFQKFETNCAPVYMDTSIPGLSPKIYYWWSIQEEKAPDVWKEIFSLEGDEAYQIRLHLPNIGNFRIWHKVEDSNNLTDEITKYFTETECPCGRPPPDQTGKFFYPGGGPARDRPKIHIEYLGKKEREKVKLMLKLLKTEGKKYEIT